MQLHCISGLPRAGSTLLACLLAQNPQVQASIMSPVLGIVRTLVDQMQAKTQGSVFISDDIRHRVVAGAIGAFYADAGDTTVVDTNRGWCAHLALLNAVAPDAKTICMVRDIAPIIASLERLQQENAFQYWLGSKLNLYDRVASYVARDGVVGYALNALREACWGPHCDKLLLVRYDTLVQKPAAVMETVHAWLSLPPYTYDFNHVEYPATFDEFDARLGVPGLHRVRQRVESQPDKQLLLPPDVIRDAAARNFWDDPANCNRVAVC